jgi:hypothetical protein
MRRELRDVVEEHFDCDAPQSVDGLLLCRRR